MFDQSDPDLFYRGELYLCIGKCYQTARPFSHMYWAQWALSLMDEGFTLSAPQVDYQRDGDKIIRTNTKKNRQNIFLLVDEWDAKGRRLGVWPD
jgi:hypothetical protein